MNLGRIAIQNSRTTLISMFLLVAVGVTTFLNYPSAEDPTITIRSASIEASYPGMSAERVEELIASPVETAMREIAEIRSTSKTGSVKITIEVDELINDLALVWQGVRNKINDLKPRLPQDVQGPTVNDQEDLTAIATIALWSDGFTMAELLDVAEDTRDRVYTLDSVRKVQTLGSQQEKTYLGFDPIKLAGLGLSMEQVFGALSSQNIIEPGGAVQLHPIARNGEDRVLSSW